MGGSTDGGSWHPSAAQCAVRDAVARAFGVEPEIVIGRSRKRGATRARQAAAWVVRQRWPALSLVQLGRIIGVSEHSSAQYAIRCAERYRAREYGFREATDALVADLPVPTLAKLTIVPQPRVKAAPPGRPIRLENIEVSFRRSGTWCDQCDALVGVERATRCRDRWCSMKARA